MSFSFQWPRFSDQFHADAIEMLNAALNKGPKPPVIADKIEVVELEMGSQVRSSIPASQSPALPADHCHTVVSCASPPNSKFATSVISLRNNFVEFFVLLIRVMHTSS
jgi:hypothetical protein